MSSQETPSNPNEPNNTNSQPEPILEPTSEQDKDKLPATDTVEAADSKPASTEATTDPVAPSNDSPSADTPDNPTSPTTTEQTAPKSIKPTPVVGVKGVQIKANKGVTQVSVPQRIATPAPRVPVKVVSDNRDKNPDFFVQKATNENSLPMQTLIHDLTKYEKALSREGESDLRTCAKNMAGLYQLLLRTINVDKTTEQFREQWQYILSMFKEKKNGGLGMHRVFRGAPEWSVGHEEYKLYQKLINLIEADLRYNGDRTMLRKVVNFDSFNTLLVTDGGRGRLLGYYS